MKNILMALSTAALFAVPATANAQSAKTQTATPPTMLHSGALHSLEAPTSGNVSVEEKAGKVTVKLSNLKTEAGPGLEVWLYAAAAPAKGATDASIMAVKYLKVGDLKTFRGNFSFTAPAGTKIADFKSVVLWCATVKTAFAAGDLK